MEANCLNVLIVVECQCLAEKYGKALTQLGLGRPIHTEAAYTIDDALAKIAEGDYNLIVAGDLLNDGFAGSRLVTELHQTGGTVPVLVYALVFPGDWPASTTPSRFVHRHDSLEKFGSAVRELLNIPEPAPAS